MASRLQKKENTYILTLDRPEAGNAVNRELTEELAGHLTAVEEDPTAVALILTGAGDRFFCTGGDVKEYAALPDRDAVARQFAAMQAVCSRLEQLPIPTIAAINGLALGGGVELALALDFRVAARGAVLSLPQVRLGLITGWGGHWRLVRAVGENRARQLLLTAARLTAPEALALGLLQRVGNTAMAEAQALVAELRQAAPLALRAMKASVREAAAQPYAAAMATANERFLAAWFSQDHREAERAFSERRPPAFEGR